MQCSNSSQEWGIAVVTIVKRRANHTWLDQITKVVLLWSLNIMPLALKMSCAPGTSEMSHAPGTQKHHFHSPCEQSSYCRPAWHLRWCLKLSLCLGAWSFPGWVVFSLPLSEVGLLLLFLLGTQLITLPQTTASPNGSWAESSVLVHTVVMMHRVCDGSVHRQSHVRWLATWRIVICLPTFSQQKKLIFVWLCKSVIRWLTYASWWNYWLVSWLVVVHSSWWCYWSLNVHVHLP